MRLSVRTTSAALIVCPFQYVMVIAAPETIFCYFLVA